MHMFHPTGGENTPSLEVIDSIEHKATQNQSYLTHLPKKLVPQIFSLDNLNLEEEEKRTLTTSDFYQKCLPPYGWSDVHDLSAKSRELAVSQPNLGG